MQFLVVFYVKSLTSYTKEGYLKIELNKAERRGAGLCKKYFELSCKKSELSSSFDDGRCKFSLSSLSGILK